MPLQNRVTPFGEIVATPARGLFMGNRGRLHDDGRVLKRQYSSETRWLVCVTEFRGRKRVPMSPRKYTELFFLDEATALAAGHRPCAECRNADYRRFKELWIWTNRNAAPKPPNVSAEQIDSVLQAERMHADGSKRTYAVACNSLPDGVIVTFPEEAEAYLLWRKSLFRWTPAGYDLRRPLAREALVNVLTPLSIVRTIAAGYIPALHPTAASTV
jgi:hypothetical protein